MSQAKKTTSELVAAALAFDEALQRFARAAEAVRRPELDSVRSFERVAQAINEAAETEGDLGARAQALLAAIMSAKSGQEAQATTIRDRALELKKRSDEYNALLERLRSISTEAASLNEPALKLAEASRGREGEAVTDLSALRDGVADLESRLGRAAAGASELGAEARAASFEELGREAQALHQRLSAMRNKLLLLQRSFDSAVPPVKA